MTNNQQILNNKKDIVLLSLFNGFIKLGITHGSNEGKSIKKKKVE